MAHGSCPVVKSMDRLPSTYRSQLQLPCTHSAAQFAPAWVLASHTTFRARRTPLAHDCQLPLDSTFTHILCLHVFIHMPSTGCHPMPASSFFLRLGLHVACPLLTLPYLYSSRFISHYAPHASGIAAAAAKRCAALPLPTLRADA